MYVSNTNPFMSHSLFPTETTERRETAPREKTHLERYKALEEMYPHILSGGNFQEMNSKFLPVIPEVLQDQFLIIPAEMHAYIGCGDLGPCIAICVKGENVTGRKMLGVHHLSIDEPADVFKDIEQKMVEHGCPKDTLEFYLIGGNLEAHGSSIYRQEKLLELSNEYKIIGARFNLVKSMPEEFYINATDEMWDQLENLSIVFSETGILYSKQPEFFQTIEDDFLSEDLSGIEFDDGEDNT